MHVFYACIKEAALSISRSLSLSLSLHHCIQDSDNKPPPRLTPYPTDVKMWVLHHWPIPPTHGNGMAFIHLVQLPGD